MPLAIELTAARTNAFTVGQLAERLDDRFRLLTGGARTALPRHQTLRAVTDWSYDLLFDDERKVFERLAVFVGGCTLEAAEEVCSDDDAARCRDRRPRRPAGRQVARRRRRIRPIPAAALARRLRHGRDSTTGGTATACVTATPRTTPAGRALVPRLADVQAAVTRRGGWPA